MQKHPPTLESSVTASKPVLKWAGGKQRLLQELAKRLPRGKRLIEPFVGGGSVFLGLPYDSYVINDVNVDLIALWTALQTRPHEFIERAAALFHEDHRSQAAYLHLRDRFNAENDRFERAVLLPYLNRFGFNGLFRVNGSGKFNVPYGQPSKLPRFPLQEMEAAHEKLRRTTILGGGFAFALEQAGVGDVVYCDPPYLDSTAGSSFTGYSSGGFTVKDHEQLREAALLAASRGATVVISNHDTPQTRQLYRLWHQDFVPVRRSIAARASSRGDAVELFATMPWPSKPLGVQD